MPATADDVYVVSSTGRRLYVDPDDARAVELRRVADGVLSPGSVRLWEATLALRDWDTVVDVGANYGEMLLGVDLPRDARLVCFEPNPRVLPYLRRSIEESGMDIDLRELAIGASEGEVGFVMDTTWSGRSGIASTRRTDADDHRTDTVVVPVRTLDQELGTGATGSVCVKVDVEGAEHAVLDGARDLLGGDHPWAIMLEVLHMDAFEQARLASEFTMRVLDRRTGDLLVVPPASPQRVAEFVRSGWVHPQDAVLTAKEAG